MADAGHDDAIARVAGYFASSGAPAQNPQQPTESRAEIEAAATKAAEARIFGILEAEEAKGRPTLAMRLAKTPGISVEMAKTFLSGTPVETAPTKDDKPAESQAAQLGKALQNESELSKEMRDPNNSAGVKPEASDGKGNRPRFSDLAGEASPKKKGLFS